MNIDTKTPYGGIDISPEAIASVVGNAVCDCYGVVGLAPKALPANEPGEILTPENYIKAIRAKKTKQGYEIDIYLYLCFGMKIPEILSEVQKKVKYVLKQTFDLPLQAVNVFVQDMKEIPEL